MVAFRRWGTGLTVHEVSSGCSESGSYFPLRKLCSATDDLSPHPASGQNKSDILIMQEYINDLTESHKAPDSEPPSWYLCHVTTLSTRSMACIGVWHEMVDSNSIVSYLTMTAFYDCQDPL